MLSFFLTFGGLRAWASMLQLRTLHGLRAAKRVSCDISCWGLGLGACTGL